MSVEVNNPDSSGGGGGGGGGSGCFIATAANGSEMKSHVKMLREFRDRFLLTNPVGKSLVNSYYTYSPHLPNYVPKHKALRATIRFCLLPFAGVSWLALRICPAHTVRMLISIVMLVSLSMRTVLRRLHARLFRPTLRAQKRQVSVAKYVLFALLVNVLLRMVQLNRVEDDCLKW
jgi:hypothetical protein